MSYWVCVEWKYMQITKTQANIYLFSFVIIFALAIVILIDFEYMTPLYASIIFIIFEIMFMKYQPVFFVLLFLYFFGQTGAILAGIYIENGGLIIEQARFGYITGGTLRLVIYNIIFFIAAFIIYKIVIFYKPIKLRSKPLSSQMVLFINILAMLLICIILINLFLWNSPLLMKIDRIDYWNNHPMPIIKTFIGQTNVISLLLGILFISRSNLNKKRILAMFASILICIIFLGEKFTGIFSAIYFFLLPILIYKLVSKNIHLSIKKMFIAGLITIICFIPIVHYHYSVVHGHNLVLEAVFIRFGLQGHVWWAIDEYVQNSPSAIDEKQINTEISSWFDLNDTKIVGMKYLIQEVAPPQIAYAYLEKNVNFTMGYPAIILRTFGENLIYPLQFIAGIIVIIFSLHLMYKISQNQIILSIFSLKVFIEVLNAFTMGNIHYLFSLKVLSYVIVIIILEVIYQKVKTE